MILRFCLLFSSLLLVGAGDGIVPEEFAARRQKLMASVGEGAVVVGAGKIIEDEIDYNVMLYDFYYLTGWHRQGSFLILLSGEGKSILFVAGTKPEEFAAIAKASGIADIRPEAELAAFVSNTLAKEKKIHAQSYLRGDNSWRWMEELAKGTTFDDTIGEKTTALRLVKSEAELALLRKAAAATSQGFLQAMKQARPGMNEGKLQSFIEAEFKKQGCERLAFPSIVGSGRNGTVIHYMKNNMDMEDGTLVVCDVGGKYQWYAADITRTLPVNGIFTDEQKELYTIVLEAQKLCEQALKPGVTIMDLHKIAKEAIAAKGYGKYFPHVVGHFVGLDVHDCGGFRQTLTPGMVITIEPGIYIENRRIGIRIEDTYVVTKDGFERISKDAPREIGEIEKIMTEGRR